MTALSIAVCGQSWIEDPEVARLAREVGAAIVRAGATLVCGGRGGVMSAACEGAAEARAAAGGRGGLIVGILPSAKKSEANPHCDVIVPTGIGLARNSIVVLAGDAVIAVGGGSGTLSEIAYAWQYGKPVIALAPSGGWAARLAGERLDLRRTDVVHAAQTPEQAVQLALELAEAGVVPTSNVPG